MDIDNNMAGLDFGAYNRIMVVGNNGSGKSYFSDKLSFAIGLPVIHLDTLFWRPGWLMPSEDEWREINAGLVCGKKWIIEGNVNHGGTMEMRYNAADLIIFLDINDFVCFISVFKRRSKRAGWPTFLVEKIDVGFINLLKGLLRYNKTRRKTLMLLRAKYPDKPFLVIKSRKKINKLLKQENVGVYR